MVGFHRKVSLLYCRVYNLTLSLKRNISWKTGPFACQSFLDWNRVHFPLKTIETKNSDFQVQHLFWGPPIVWFHGTPGFSRGFSRATKVVCSEEHQRFADLLDRLTVQRDPKAGGKGFGRGRDSEHLAGCRWERFFFHTTVININWLLWAVVTFWGGC